MSSLLANRGALSGHFSANHMRRGSRRESLSSFSAPAAPLSACSGGTGGAAAAMDSSSTEEATASPADVLSSKFTPAGDTEGAQGEVTRKRSRSPSVHALRAQAACRPSTASASPSRASLAEVLSEEQVGLPSRAARRLSSSYLSATPHTARNVFYPPPAELALAPSPQSADTPHHVSHRHFTEVQRVTTTTTTAAVGNSGEEDVPLAVLYAAYTLAHGQDTSSTSHGAARNDLHTPERLRSRTPYSEATRMDNAAGEMVAQCGGIADPGVETPTPSSTAATNTTASSSQPGTGFLSALEYQQREQHNAVHASIPGGFLDSPCSVVLRSLYATVSQQEEGSPPPTSAAAAGAAPPPHAALPLPTQEPQLSTQPEAPAPQTARRCSPASVFSASQDYPLLQGSPGVSPPLFPNAAVGAFFRGVDAFPPTVMCAEPSAPEMRSGAAELSSSPSAIRAFRERATEEEEDDGVSASLHAPPSCADAASMHRSVGSGGDVSIRDLQAAVGGRVLPMPEEEPPELDKVLEREIAEDLRLSMDVAFTPSGAGNGAPPLLSQSSLLYVEEEEEERNKSRRSGLLLEDAELEPPCAGSAAPSAAAAEDVAAPKAVHTGEALELQPQPSTSIALSAAPPAAASSSPLFLHIDASTPIADSSSAMLHLDSTAITLSGSYQPPPPPPPQQQSPASWPLHEAPLQCIPAPLVRDRDEKISLAVASAAVALSSGGGGGSRHRTVFSFSSRKSVPAAAAAAVDGATIGGVGGGAGGCGTETSMPSDPARPPTATTPQLPAPGSCPDKEGESEQAIIIPPAFVTAAPQGDGEDKETPHLLAAAPALLGEPLPDSESTKFGIDWQSAKLRAESTVPDNAPEAGRRNGAMFTGPDLALEAAPSAETPVAASASANPLRTPPPLPSREASATAVNAQSPLRLFAVPSVSARRGRTCFTFHSAPSPAELDNSNSNSNSSVMLPAVVEGTSGSSASGNSLPPVQRADPVDKSMTSTALEATSALMQPSSGVSVVQHAPDNRKAASFFPATKPALEPTLLAEDDDNTASDARKESTGATYAQNSAALVTPVSDAFVAPIPVRIPLPVHPSSLPTPTMTTTAIAVTDSQRISSHHRVLHDKEEETQSAYIGVLAGHPSPPPSPPSADHFYDLPRSVGDFYASRRGVAKLYDWQHELLTQPEVRRGRSFIYSLPTSGGKTLVAELSLLRCVLNRRQSCFFVLPFVSLAEEKTLALQPLANVFDFNVDGHYGSFGRFPLCGAPAIYVCTIEKANSLLNYMLEENRTAEIGAVVVDELHMVGESRRGATLELFLSKLLMIDQARQELRRKAAAAAAQAQAERDGAQTYSAVKGVHVTAPAHGWPGNEEEEYSPGMEENMSYTTHKTHGEEEGEEAAAARQRQAAAAVALESFADPGPLQIIGMSATVPNLRTIAEWLHAACFERDFRPVPLHAYSVVGGLVLRDGQRNERNLSGDNVNQHLIELATEMPEASVLVFCASRQQCVDTAKGIVNYIKAQAIAGQQLPSLPGNSATASSPAPFSVFGVVFPNVATKSAVSSVPSQASPAMKSLLGDLEALSHYEASQLSEVVPYGVAFHHGGLLTEERELIEAAFRRKHVRILCSTSTLAAGVNLPARRVIIKTPYVGRDFLTKARYLQMCGRAGRAGLDPYGESYLLLSRRDQSRGHALMHAPVEPSTSQILEDDQTLTRSLLECVGVGLVTDWASARRWCASLLSPHAVGPVDGEWKKHVQAVMAKETVDTRRYIVTGKVEDSASASTDTATAVPGPQTATSPESSETSRSVPAPVPAPPPAPLTSVPTRALESMVRAALDTLARCGLVAVTEVHSEDEEVNNDDVSAVQQSTSATEHAVLQVCVTPFGSSSVRSCFTVEEALLLREELEELRHTGLILSDDLHLCYFLTPLREVGECNWELLLMIMARMSDSRQRIASLLGVDPYFINQQAMGLGGPLQATEEGRRRLFTAKRFYVALILADVLAEVPMTTVEQQYNVNRGQLQNLMRSASMFSSSITSFCHAMEWYSLEAVLSSFVKRLGFGVKPDLLPLMEIRGIQPPRARALWNAGFKTLSLIAAADADDMVAKVKLMNPADSKAAKFFTKRSALMVIREAHLTLQSQIKEKKGELQELTLRDSSAVL